MTATSSCQETKEKEMMTTLEGHKAIVTQWGHLFEFGKCTNTIADSQISKRPGSVLLYYLSHEAQWRYCDGKKLE